MPKSTIGWFTAIIVIFLAAFAVSGIQRPSCVNHGAKERHNTHTATIEHKGQKHERLLSTSNGLVLYHLRKEVCKSLSISYTGPSNPYLDTENEEANHYFAAIRITARKKILGMLFPFHCHW